MKTVIVLQSCRVPIIEHSTGILLRADYASPSAGGQILRRIKAGFRIPVFLIGLEHNAVVHPGVVPLAHQACDVKIVLGKGDGISVLHLLHGRIIQHGSVKAGFVVPSGLRIPASRIVSRYFKTLFPHCGELILPNTQLSSVDDIARIQLRQVFKPDKGPVDAVCRIFPYNKRAVAILDGIVGMRRHYKGVLDIPALFTGLGHRIDDHRIGSRGVRKPFLIQFKAQNALLLIVALLQFILDSAAHFPIIIVQIRDRKGKGGLIGVFPGRQPDASILLQAGG